MHTFNLLRTKVLKKYLGTKVYEFNLSDTKILKENLFGIKMHTFNLLRTKMLKKNLSTTKCKFTQKFIIQLKKLLEFLTKNMNNY